MSYVYLIASGRNIIKVGKADDVRKRVRGLQTSSAFNLQVIHTIEVSEQRSLALEKAIQKRLKRYRIRGEWFRIDRATAIKIAQHAANSFGRLQSFAQLDGAGLAAITLRCRGCRHQRTINVAPRPRLSFTCSKCNGGEFAVVV